MNISLSTSLHLDHGALSLDAVPGASLKTMQDFVPVGLLSLKASCDAVNPEANIRVFEVNTMLNRGEITNGPGFHTRLAEAVLPKGTDFAGLMTDADSFHHTVAVAREIKRVSPSTLVCLGGPAASPVAGKLLEKFPWIDFVVRGEGEETFAELVAQLMTHESVDDVLGLNWRTPGGELRHNANRPPIDDLDLLPVPDFAASDVTDSAALYLDVGRGCTFNCSFCSTAPFWSRRFRMKSILRIIKEMRHLRNGWGRSHFNFSHDIFTADKKWIERFCAAIEEAALGVTWTCSTRTDCIDVATLAAMARAGCVEIYYGIETGTAAMQGSISKNLDLARSIEIVRATRAAGIRPVTGFIVGYPNETLESYSGTVTSFFEFLEAGGHRAHIFTLCPFPGAPMFDEAANHLATRAEDLELPLDVSSHSVAEALVAGHRDIFSSRYRFGTPNVPWPLVASMEEVSAQMVVLKRLWPHILPLFGSAAELIERWSVYISGRNRARPWRRTYHGSAADIIDFVKIEIPARGVASRTLTDLVCYEAAMITAAGFEQPAETEYPGSISEMSLVAASRPYLVTTFHHDMSALLLGGDSEDTVNADPHWVVFARNCSGNIDAIAVSDVARRLLELAASPHPASSLVEAVLPDLSVGIDARTRAYATLKSLEALDLVREIRS